MGAPLQFALMSPFAWVSFAMMTGVMSTALISPLYPLYQEAWALQTSDITGIYVAYMLGALLCLLFLGRLPDRIGFKQTMTWSLSLSFIGTLGTMFAWDLNSLLLHRFVVGISSTLMTSSAIKGLSAVATPQQQTKVPLMSSFMLAFGFGMGPLTGGVFGQWVPHPLLTCYIPSLLLTLLALYQLRDIHDHAAAVAGRQALHWKDCLPKLTWTESANSSAFALICCFPFMGFAVFGLYASLSPLFVDRLLPWHGPFVSGAAIATILLISAGIQIYANRIAAHRSGMWGMLTQAACSIVLMVNLKLGSTTLFIIGIALAAIGHAMCLLPGLTLLQRVSTPERQTGLFATYLVVGYMGSIVPALGLGYMADHWGLDAAVTWFSVAVVILGLVWAYAIHRHPRLQTT